MARFTQSSKTTQPTCPRCDELIAGAAPQAACPAPLELLGAGPLEPEIALPSRVSYQDLIAERAKDREEAELTVEQLAAVVVHHDAKPPYSSLITDALADRDENLENIVDLMSQAGRPLESRFRSIGAIVVNAIREYSRGMIADDVQDQRESNARAARIEERAPDTLDTELGLSRSLR
jgi:hypothetical protein